MRHRPQELERFVEAIDAALPEPASILVIGGAAAALAYGATRPTDDIDTFHPLTPVVQKAVEAASRFTDDNPWSSGCCARGRRRVILHGGEPFRPCCPSTSPIRHLTGWSPDYA